MAVAAAAFQVATEFVFNQAVASAEIGKVQQSIDSLSQSAENAVAQVKSLGINFALQFTGIGGGILGLLGSALKASDDFTKSQLDLTNLISANLNNLTGTVGTFNEQMLVSKRIIQDVAKDAVKFGIPAQELLGFTKALGAFLLPKGLAGTNLEQARNISRNLLKSAPILGIDPSFAGGQLIRAIEGQADIVNPVFRRLLQEAPEPFKAAGITGAKQFNALDIAKRFNILNEAMRKFSSNTEVLTRRANTLGGIIQRVRDLFTGFNSILKPLGDVILPPLIKLINIAIDFMQTKGRELVRIAARFLEPFLRNPRKLLLDLVQVSQMAKDVKTSAQIVGFASSIFFTIQNFGELMGWLSGKFPSLVPKIEAFRKGFNALLGRSRILTFIWTKLVAVWGMFAKFMGGGLLISLAKFTGLFALLAVLFQAFSRALVISKMNKAIDFAQKSTRIFDAITRIKEAFLDIMSPVQDIIEGLAQFMAATILTKNSIFSVSTSAGILTFLLESIATVMKSAAQSVKFFMGIVRGAIAGFTSAIVNLINLVPQMISKIMTFDFSGAFDIAKIGIENVASDAFEEFLFTLTRNVGTIGEDDTERAVATNITNIGKVEIKNDFKEQVQPDRIAFSIKDQLMKAAQNPTQARNRSFAGALAR